MIATHNPLVGLAGLAGSTLFQTKLALYTSYVIAGVRRAAPCQTRCGGIRVIRITICASNRISISTSSSSVARITRRGNSVIRRSATVASRSASPRSFLESRLTHRWSGQVIETPDGLPYIGQSADHQYVATGFAGNGLTFGTLAGIMISDAILGRSNPWAELFDPSRKALARGLWDYLKENVDYPYYMIRDRFAGSDGQSLRGIKRGQGRIIDRNGAKAAVYRDQAGRVTLRSAICAHLGCAVGWNTAERTWDCPCHGSRFTPTGKVIAGPAEGPLSRWSDARCVRWRCREREPAQT